MFMLVLFSVIVYFVFFTVCLRFGSKYGLLLLLI